MHCLVQLLFRYRHVVSQGADAAGGGWVRRSFLRELATAADLVRLNLGGRRPACCL